MKKFLCITLLMLCSVMWVPLAFAAPNAQWKSRVEAITNDEAGGLVFAKIAPTTNYTQILPEDKRYYTYADVDDPQPEDFKASIGETLQCWGGADPEGIYTTPRIHLFAKPNPGYVFVRWEIDGFELDDYSSNDPNHVLYWNHTRFDKNNQIIYTGTNLQEWQDKNEVPVLNAKAVFVAEPTSKIQGYFRVQNTGNGLFMEVTGPFSGAPNVSADDAKTKAGSIIYVEAVQDTDSDGEPCYRITSLRSQGIDVAKDIIPSNEYTSTLGQILMDGLLSGNLSDAVYKMMRQGFASGYTSVARATVGSVFAFVGSKLADGNADDLNALVDRFNEEVTATLDLGIRLKKVGDNTFQMFFDVPSFQPVCTWYAKEANHDLFTSATVAMTNLLAGRDINLEFFTQNDINLFKEWGYTLPVDKFTQDGDVYKTTFEYIFSDPVLLFNWVKWVGYMVFYPESNSGKDHNMANLGFGSLADNANNHYLTQTLLSYFPRLHHDTRAYLINGRVNNGSWDAAGNSIGFASRTEMETVGPNGNWQLYPVDNTTEPTGILSVNLPQSLDGTNYTAAYYDFPVTAAKGVTLNGLSTQQNAYGYEYVTLGDALTGEVDGGTAIMVSSTDKTARLNVGDGFCYISDLVNVSAPQGSIAISDNIADKQYVRRRAAEASDAFTGVYLSTALNQMNNYWEIDPENVYTLSAPKYINGEMHLIFKGANENDNIAANQAVYLPTSTPDNGFVVIGELQEQNTSNETLIQGYFRVENQGNGKIMEVTGPFSGAPNVEPADAESKAGTIIYVEAAADTDADGEQCYRVTSLRSQGIDVAKNVIPSADYVNTMSKILESAQESGSSAVYAMMREGFKNGYTSIARATVGTVFWFVGSKLGTIGNSDRQSDFEALVDRFNETVTANLDLGIRLKPVEGQENTLQMYFDVPSFQPVCTWYQDEENYELFTEATEAMSTLLDGAGINLEHFTKNDIDLFAEWGYTLPAELAKDNYVTTFSYIFQDPVLLFNWVKWVGYMILNPESPSAEDHNMGALVDILGLGDLAERADDHYLTQTLLSYFPRLHHNTRAYLINGRVNNGSWDAADNSIGFASRAEMKTVGDNGNWTLLPVDNENGIFTVALTQNLNNSTVESDDNTVSSSDEKTAENGNYETGYYDFPVTATEGVTLYTLSGKDFKNGYDYVTLESLGSDEIAAQTPMIVYSPNEDKVQLTVADGEWKFIDLSALPGLTKYQPETLSDTESGETTVAPTGFQGIMLSTSLGNMNNYWEIAEPVFAFSTPVDVSGVSHLDFIDAKENVINSIAANKAIYVSNNIDAGNSTLLIDPATLVLILTPTDTGEEEDHPTDETKNVRIAQGFDGTGANEFPDLITFSAELKYGTDFEVAVSVPSDIQDHQWVAPSNVNNLNESYLEAFTLIQPNPFDSETQKAEYDAYVPALYQQYIDLFTGDNGAQSMNDDFVDGFYLSSHLTDTEDLAIFEASEPDADGYYSYNLSFDAPCSGIYEITVKPSEGSGYDFPETVHRVKIYPNLYAEFGPNKTPGFNIAGYNFTYEKEGDKYIVYLPQSVDSENELGEVEKVDIDLSNLTAYIPGTYFASTLTITTDDGGVTKTNLRRANELVSEDSNSAYYASVPDLTSSVENNTPIHVTVEKNGVSATYDFYVTTTTDPDNVSTGIEEIESEEGEVVYYNLQGVRIDNPEHGIYLKVVNGKATKVVL